MSDEPVVTPERDDDVRELLELAGPRPPLPAEQLARMTAAARAAWRGGLESSTEANEPLVAGPTAAPEVEPSQRPLRFPTDAGPERRSRRPLVAALAALAATVALAIGISRWRDATVPLPSQVAMVEAAGQGATIATGDATALPLRVGGAVPAGSQLRTGAGPEGSVALRLSGGAALRIAAASEARLVAADTLDLERGALYVDTGTARPGGRAVVVRTDLGIARDVGTRFMVRLVEGGGRAFRVQVRDGSVAVERNRSREVAAAGEELTLRGDGSIERRRIDAFGDQWEWVLRAAPSFDVRGCNVVELLDWVSRETGWRIRFEDPELAEAATRIRFGGSIGHVSADRAAEVLPGAGLTSELHNGTLVVRRASR
jgi:hypothetical protein